MDIGKCIKKRRSCRAYVDKKVPDEIVLDILDGARLAPSAGNIQSWKFIIVTSDKMKEKLSKACMDQTWMADAPVFVVVCNDRKKVLDHYEGKGEKYGVQHAAIATTFILLKAAEHGLGSCWVGGFDEDEIAKILSIPDSVDPEVIITLGYPKNYNVAEEKYDLKDLVYFGKYGKKDTTSGMLPLKDKIAIPYIIQICRYIKII